MSRLSNDKADSLKSSQRIVYLDVLRIFSIFCMMMLHVASSNWHTTPVESFEWQTFNAYDSIVRFCVPVFVMISGSFFLDNSKEITLKKLFSKNISRIAAAFFFWSFIYSIVKYATTVNKEAFTFGIWFKSFICGHYHLWFMFAICGLYLLTPLLRKITAEKKLTEYFLILSFIFCNIVSLLKIITPIAPTVQNISSNFNMQFVAGYSGYFVLGYYLKSADFSAAKRKIIYILGAAGIISTAVATSIWSVSKGSPVGSLYGYFAPNVYFAAASVFVFFRYTVSKINWSSRALKIISKLSSLSFGMYLVHDLFNIAFKQLDFTTLDYNAILSVPCNTLIVFSSSLIIAFLLNKIPFINKYII